MYFRPRVRVWQGKYFYDQSLPKLLEPTAEILIGTLSGTKLNRFISSDFKLC